MLENPGLSEEWRQVVGYEGYYEVSSHGRVRRMKAYYGTYVGRIMSISYSDGYAYVHLCKNDRKRKRGVHILVAEAFHGRRPRNKFPKPQRP